MNVVKGTLNLMKNDISKWVNLKSCSLNSIDFADKCRQKLSDTGVLLLPQFQPKPQLLMNLLRQKVSFLIKLFLKKPSERR